MDAQDRQILALLVQDGRRTYDDIAGRVSLSAPAVLYEQRKNLTVLGIHMAIHCRDYIDFGIDIRRTRR